MSDKKTTKLKVEKNEAAPVEQKVITDPFVYGYSKGTLVTVSAEVFAAAMQFLGGYAQGEITENIIFNEFPTATGPVVDERGQIVAPEEKVVLSISRKGKQAEGIFNELMDVHITNINNGLAINMEEPAQPKVDLSK